MRAPLYCLYSFLCGLLPLLTSQRKKINVLLGLWKSKIVPNFWSRSCWACYSSWVSRAIFAYSESSWSALCLLVLWKDFVTCQGTLWVWSMFLLLWRFGRWIQPVPLSAESTSSVNKTWDPKAAYNKMRSRETCCLCINGRRRKVLSVKMLKCEARGKRAMKRLASRLQPGWLASGAGWSFLPEQRSCDSLTRFPQILALGLSSWPALGMHISPVPSECCQAGVTCSVNCEMLIQAG